MTTYALIANATAPYADRKTIVGALVTSGTLHWVRRAEAAKQRGNRRANPGTHLDMTIIAAEWIGDGVNWTGYAAGRSVTYLRKGATRWERACPPCRA